MGAHSGVLDPSKTTRHAQSIAFCYKLSKARMTPRASLRPSQVPPMRHQRTIRMVNPTPHASTWSRRLLGGR